MKTTLSILSIIFSISSVLAQNVTIPDANFKAALVANTSINTNEDTEIQVSEAQAYNLELEVNDLGITDLTGIEAFVNLFGLNCNNNQLTTIDISQNTALYSLFCNENQLTNLDVSQNTALHVLSCGANPINNLDVSLNTSLTHLSCPSNQLSSLDLSQNSSLTSLFCPINNLTSLDLTENPNLMELNCMMNQLTTLDIRNGHNENMDNDNFTTIQNPNLTCIFVDDAVYATTNWTNIDTSSTFVETETACEELAVTTCELSNLVLYPNPSMHSLHIQMDTPLKNARIYSLQGQKQLESKSKDIDISNLAVGYYIIKIENEVGRIAIRSLIKE